MFGVRLKAMKGGFFDRKRVQSSMDAATHKALSRYGAFVRRRAQTSIRKRRRVSEPGQPPSSHQGSLRRMIFFFADKQAQSVIIGPAKFGSASPPAPQVLEFGGAVVGTRPGIDPKTGERLRRPVRLSYRARPFMGPADQAERKNLPKLWQNSLR